MKDWSMVTNAIRVAVAAHDESALDKGGERYIYHPLRVMNAVRHMGDEVAAAAVLHDVLEDTPWTPEELLLWVPQPVIDDVVALTRGAGESYDDYIGRIKAAGSVVTAIKIADLRDNLGILDPTRPHKPMGDSFIRYAVALHRLEFI